MAISGAMPNHPKKHRKNAIHVNVERLHRNAMEIAQADGRRFVANVHTSLLNARDRAMK